MSAPDEHAAETPPSAPDPAPVPDSPASLPRRRRWPRLLRRLSVAALIVLAVAGGGLVSAEYYTSRPAFCGTCHIMGPYYQSWSRDKHGAKLGARCVDCHYAPGEQHTLHAKFKGLSQVTSYFSGRYGASRPRAHVNDASCLTARCHGDNAYLTKAILIGEPRKEKRFVGDQETEVERTPTVQFVHEKHLRVQPKQVENEAQRAEIRRKLEQSAAPEAWARIAAVSKSVLPAVETQGRLHAILKELQRDDLETDAQELIRLEHRQMRLEQLTNLSCAACHSYDASGVHHVLPADLQTCFTCHFNNQAFNRDTSECLRCHQPPQRKILIHDQPTTTYWRGQAVSAPAGPVLMDHRDIVARSIECASCHLDVIQGQASVTVRDCTHCHDQQKYLEDFERRDSDRVVEYHREHVKAQRARCVDCHRAIQHRLVDPTRVGTTAGFLQPVLDDCRHCHPSHHSEQVALLTGTGGLGVPRPMPNAMIGSRLNCSACHTKPTTDMKGDELIKASQATCIACHGSDYDRLFQQWMNELASYLKEAEGALARVDQQMEAWRTAGRELPAGLTDAVAQARTNVRLVRAGNGIHNKNYALELLDLSIRNLDQAMTILTAPGD